ncbi:MAG: BREX system P-loop protein BrxC [Candidatus Cloacimonetes bacterium]|nr:BREX system P-loop protein BrxC [Candidatus Cloacimonadota bacterium]MDY0229163.1 BREX system P-loop protein BrxC [Candidatus Cloacimonadaceae bacterium]
MKNRDIYLKDPTQIKLVNEGVAYVNDEMTDQALEVLRYELETFVCDGQYEKGLNHILQTYLNNIHQAQQPSVWISGFYGSGKSHLAKMLRALWLDTAFPDGATARGIANLPQSTRDLLKEHSTQAKRHGGVHAASGTLGSGSNNVRLALLGIVLKSRGLPEQYQKAKFVMWMKHEGVLDSVRDYVVSKGANWAEELDNFYVAEVLHDALIEIKPNVFISHKVCMDTLINLYPNAEDISIDDMLKTLKSALMIDGKLPLTAIILDEMQQYIGESSERSLDVQETIEACTKTIGGKLIIVATGQTAISGTANLKKLEGRFTIPIQLSDNDVDTVIRKVFLSKNPSAKSALDALYKNNIGELCRHLSGSSIAHKPDDEKYFAADYPILPVRRRFWEEVLRVLDQTGTDSQLRNQLSTIHKAIQTNIDRPLGHVISADYLYFDSAVKLLQGKLLPNKIFERTMLWIASDNADERLLARACGLIFLINKINSHNADIGIRALTETLADLLLEDITSDSSLLRSRLPKLLDGCALLMKVKDEYRIQTEESVAWNNEFLSQKSTLASSMQVIDSEREERIKQQYALLTKGMSIMQGVSKVPREVSLCHTAGHPEDHREKLYVWLRNGWSVDENSARVDAQQLGNDSPLITVYLAKKDSDAIRTNLIELKAAENTLRIKGNPATAEGVEARSAIETIKNTAELKLGELFQELFKEAKLIQAGGTEIGGTSFKASLETAIKNSLLRLYPKFSEADDSRWSRVYDKAMRGAPDALAALDYSGEPDGNPICKAILGYIANSKKGDEVRKHFDKAPYGWPRDAVDAGMVVLLVAGIIKALDERNQVIELAKLERKNIGKAVLKIENVVLSAAQRIKIRRLYQSLGINCNSGDEYESSSDFIGKTLDLIEQSGGEAPQPIRQNTEAIEQIRLCTGNERLMAIHNSYDELSIMIVAAKELADNISIRLPNWELLTELLELSDDLNDIKIIRSQVEQIEEQRLLLADPDPVAPILAALSQSFRQELNRLKQDYDSAFSAGIENLDNDANWQALEQEQQEDIRKANLLDEESGLSLKLSDPKAIIHTLKKHPLSSIKDKIAALPARMSKAQEEAARILEPQTQVITLPIRTLKTTEDLELWLIEIKSLILETLSKGPVIFN